MNDRIDLNQTQYFEITIAGHLGDRRTRIFEDYQVTQFANGQTLISGGFKDQAQLFGILIRIRDMGTPLLSVNILKPNCNQAKGGSK